MATDRVCVPRPSPRWRRYSVDIPLRIVTQRIANNITTNGHGTELYGGEMTVFAVVELAVGDQIALEFTPPYSGRLISIRGFVRNRTGHTYSIEFITENDADYDAVDQLESVVGQMSFPPR